MLAQKSQIPSVYRNLSYENNQLVFTYNDQKIIATPSKEKYSYEQFTKQISGTNEGLFFDFQDEQFSGTIYFGLIPQNDSKHPYPVYFRSYLTFKNGKAEVPITSMKGQFDMIGWEQTGHGILGYRILDSSGQFIYDGKIGFKGKGPFEVDDCVIEGPFINKLTYNEVTISFKTNSSIKAVIEVDGKKFSSKRSNNHEIRIDQLEPDKTYTYIVNVGQTPLTYSFKTAPLPGSRLPFTFSYSSDSRANNGGGERDIHGTNAYIMKKIMALNSQKGVSFMQFSGDMINGYSKDQNAIKLEYANWKRAIEPFAQYFPVITSMGNHEALIKEFIDPKSSYKIRIDQFPFDTHSSEAIYAEEFVNFENGPKSEDGSIYDPNPNKIDFPSYRENVFFYTYDNIGMIVLNSNYLFCPSHLLIHNTGGNIHGYIMDNQLKWMEETLNTLDKDENIDHVFITIHTPFFPNGGHVADDMWYNGENSIRPSIAGKRVAKGIIERRDELLDIIINKSQKTKAILTGDEHNYVRTLIDSETNMYPENYFLPKLEISRSIWQVNNGAAGAPYYSQQKTPWTDKTESFTTQNALVFFYVDGKKLKMEVFNPDTLEKIDELEWD